MNSVPCLYYRYWEASAWSPCSRSCDLGEQVKEVYCVAQMGDNSTKRVDEENCYKQYGTKPEYQRSCNDEVPCTVGVMWMFSGWGQVRNVLFIA